jgi:flagellar biosynthesis protein FlhF
MRLRIFTGTSVAQAMDKVRLELGNDAVIIHVDAGVRGGITRVTAAVEKVISADPATPKAIVEKRHIAAPNIQDLPVFLRYHGLPPGLAKKLSDAAQHFTDMSIYDALSAALDSHFRFRPLRGRVEERLVLIGQPGQGKTLMAARLAAMAVSAGRKARVITTDSESAGAMAQLKAFCEPLKVDVLAATSAAQAEQYLQARYDGLQVIDTAGINPYSLADVEMQARLLNRLQAEALWVVAANTDAQEAADVGEIFASLGVQRVIASRADSTRRFSAVMSILARCKLALAGFSASPFVGDKMQPGTALTLATRLIDCPDPSLIARYTKAKAA